MGRAHYSKLITQDSILTTQIKTQNVWAGCENTHYYNSNLIWRIVSRRVDEVKPSDHPRREARSSYYYNNLFIIYLFLTMLRFYNLFYNLNSMVTLCIN